jgi:hypothetical protein
MSSPSAVNCSGIALFVAKAEDSTRSDGDSA